MKTFKIFQEVQEVYTIEAESEALALEALAIGDYTPTGYGDTSITYIEEVA
jgi:hypothetical protein